MTKAQLRAKHPQVSQAKFNKAFNRLLDYIDQQKFLDVMLLDKVYTTEEEISVELFKAQKRAEKYD